MTNARFESIATDDPRVRPLFADFIRETDGPLGIDLEAEIAAGPPDLAPPGGTFLLIEVGENPAGFGGIRDLDTDVAEIKAMYVAPLHRSKGLARAMLTELEDIARRHGCGAVRLDTSSYLTDAIALYGSAGYRKVADYNGNPKANLWFERTFDLGSKAVIGSPPTDTPSGSLDYERRRDELLESLALQRRALASSIVLTPADSLPLFLADRDHTGFLHGLYLTDKDPDSPTRRNSPILFGNRERAARDLRKIQDLLATALGAAAGSLRLLSGLHAHTATFMSIGSPGQTVMLLPVRAGGHFNTHAILQRLGLHTIDLPVDAGRLCIDRPAALDFIEREKPDFLFIDRSEGLRYEDFEFIGSLSGPRTVFDASHFLPQILTGRYENPLKWGFDLMLFSLHKSFPGPQKAGIVSREDDDLWSDLVAGLSKFVSSSHAEDSYLLGLTLLRPDSIEAYTSRLLETAEELELQLLRRGLDVIPRTMQGSPDWPGTHHVWLRAEGKKAAYAQFESLSKANLHTNYRELPYDLGYGLRLGTSFSAVAGTTVDHIEELSAVVQAALEDGDSLTLRGRVGELAENARANSLVPEQQIWDP